MVNAPLYVRNADLHRDLKMEMVTAEIKRFARKHEERLHHHDNVEAIQLLDKTKLPRRLKRTKPFELAN
jgi:alpha-D-ribose 1-methylphosphonate 5-triphosphate synthase subunit PhnI